MTTWPISLKHRFLRVSVLSVSLFPLESAVGNRQLKGNQNRRTFEKRRWGAVTSQLLYAELLSDGIVLNNVLLRALVAMI